MNAVRNPEELTTLTVNDIIMAQKGMKPKLQLLKDASEFQGITLYGNVEVCKELLDLAVKHGITNLRMVIEDPQALVAHIERIENV